jgi:hypothetical protein
MVLRNITLSEIKTNFDDRFNVETTDWIPRLNRWVMSGVGMIHSGLLYNPSAIKVTFTDNLILMPIDMKVLQGITYNGLRLVPSDIKPLAFKAATEKTGTSTYYFLGNANSDKFVVDPTGKPIEMKLPDLEGTTSQKTEEAFLNSETIERFNYTYTIMRDNVIRINVPETEGDVILFYKSLPYVLNNDGSIEATIPDNENLIEALNWFILYRLIGRGYKHHTYDYKYVDQQWELNRRKAKRSISALSVDKQQIAHMMFTNLLSDYDRWFKLG